MCTVDAFMSQSVTQLCDAPLYVYLYLYLSLALSFCLPLPLSLCRRPSQWLSPGVTALTRMVSSSSTPMLRRAQEAQGESESEAEREVEEMEMRDRPRPLRYICIW